VAIRNIHHTGIVVADLDQSLRFWHEAAGLPVTKQGETDALRLALLSLGNTYIELMQPKTADSEFGRFLARTGGGMNHLAFESTSVADDHARVRERGLEVLWGGVMSAFTGDTFFVTSEATQGVLVQYVEPEYPTELHRREDALFTEAVIVATLTGDLFASVRQWEQNFGLRTESYLVAPEADNRHIMIPTGEPGAVYIEVIKPLTATGKNEAYLQKVGDGLFQIGVRANDPTAAVQALNDAGYRAMQTEGMDQGRLASFVHPKSTGNVFLAVFPPGPIPSGPVPW
jgi:methylmalonyl-CoA/ethylmalonyl-CoA epimerase